jgi:hypothetical protein
MLVGASYPGTSRLYEFTSGFVIAQNPFAWRRMPPMKLRHTPLSCRGAFASKNTLVGPEKSDMCVCIPDPLRP